MKKLFVSSLALVAMSSASFAQGSQMPALPSSDPHIYSSTVRPAVGTSSISPSAGSTIDTQSFVFNPAEIVNVMQARFNPGLTAALLGAACITATVGAGFFVIGKMRSSMS